MKGERRESEELAHMLHHIRSEPCARDPSGDQSDSTMTKANFK